MFDNSNIPQCDFLEVCPEVSLLERENNEYEDVASFSVLHRGPTQSVWVADCYFIVNVLDLPFASPIAIYR